MKLLDLYCGAGGCTRGYQRAGFWVTGVDFKPQPRYVGEEFHQADAIEFVRKHGHEFDAIHASPPCQAHSSLKSMPNAKKHIDMIPKTRVALIATGKPYVIENVMGAPLINPIMLCGTMFGLGVAAARAELRRHRIFESNMMLMTPGTCRHLEILTLGVYGDHGNGPNSRDKMKRLIAEGKIAPRPVQVVGVYGGGGVHATSEPRRRPVSVGVWGNAGGYSHRDGVQQFTTAERREAMGIDWMTGKELSQAIPPAYTEFIGTQLMDLLKRRAP